MYTCIDNLIIIDRNLTIRIIAILSIFKYVIVNGRPTEIGGGGGGQPGAMSYY